MTHSTSDPETKLSVNVNKVATLRNARGGLIPNLVEVVKDCQRFGAQGITVHPRPDERHIRRADVFDIKPLVSTEFNMEGYPTRDFLDLVEEIKPEQCTLVPDAPDVLTSSEGWDTVTHQEQLKDVLAELKSYGCRTALFMEPKREFIEGAKLAGADRIEFYTGPYANMFPENPEEAIRAYLPAAAFATEIGLEINAGHDLNRDNLPYWVRNIPQTLEVSIGHALWCDALYLGMENTIQLYKRACQHQIQ